MLNIETVTNLLTQIANADTTQTATLELLEMLQAENEENQTLMTTNEQNTERIRALQDTNQKLFLKVTAPQESGEAQTKNPAEMLEEFTKNYFN